MLAEQNPWWKKKEAITEDKYIVVWNKSTVKWEPRVGYTFESYTSEPKKDVIYVIRGPRQVGKTTFLKRWIQRLLERGTNPTNVFYWTCDLIENPSKLSELIESFLDFSATSKGRKHIFLDEISAVPGWQKAIKYLVDLGKLKNCTVILTGSHSLDIKKSAELLPGRRGEEAIPDRMFLPMKFSEYAETLNENMKEIIKNLDILKRDKRKNLIDSLLKGNLPDEIKSLNLYSKELSSLFENYLISGGVPNATHYLQKNGEIPSEIYGDHLRAVLGDLAKWNLKDRYLRQVLRRVVETLGTPVSWRTLMSGTDIASHTTVENYVDVLSDAFILSYIYNLDFNLDQPYYPGDKKIYFNDPFFFHALNGLLPGKDPFKTSQTFLSFPENKAKLVECVVSNHLIRLSFNLYHTQQYYDYANFLFYWRSKKGHEIDFALKINKKYIPIELKYSSSIRKPDLIGVRSFMMKKRLKTGIVLTKDMLKQMGNVTAIPTHLFLLIV